MRENAEGARKAEPDLRSQSRSDCEPRLEGGHQRAEKVASWGALLYSATDTAVEVRKGSTFCCPFLMG